ncbi:MAG TPA: ABC transporter permease [Actinomycetota bacterium]|nr:ABC transporter permease [Actinomycetota bacterium]
MSRARSAIGQIGPRAVAIGAVLAVWLAIYASGFFDRSIFPSPLAVGRALADGFRDGSITEALGKSVLRLAFGLSIAIVIGTGIGLAMAGSRLAERGAGSLLLGLLSLPAIAWLPLAILWVGFNDRAVIFVVSLGAFPAVALGTQAAIRQVPPVLERAGRTMGARGWTLYRTVIFPAALPGYLAGLKQGWAFAWLSLIAGELFVGGGLGLGHQLDAARARLDTPMVLAVMVVIVALGMLVDLVVFGALDRRLRARRGLTVG